MFLPRIIDNTYRGRTSALWLFGFVVLVRIAQSVILTVNGYETVKRADGVPLDSYPAAAAQTIVAMYTMYAATRLLISLLCLLVLVRYRSAVPFMFAVILLNYAAAQLVVRFVPIAKIGSPPASLVGRTLIVMTIAGLVLSLWKREPARG